MLSVPDSFAFYTTGFWDQKPDLSSFIFGADTVPGTQSWTGNVCVVVISQEALMMMVLMVVVVKVMVIMLW